ncbi:kelch-like protein 8 [Physella acuta]|uniref:kelch-like protein 8 n=1 Tax=Physella acuta TaxID=109671 RepID=UPI0027DBC3E3|nr:kelch-like protein 8 [Physella acuta]
MVHAKLTSGYLHILEILNGSNCEEISVLNLSNLHESPPPYHPSIIKQWVHRVKGFSSQYNSTSWSADQVIGPPKVFPQYGDNCGAWAQGSIDNKQFLEIQYEVPVLPKSINIYETLNSGAVVAIKVLNPSSQWDVLWRSNSAEVLTISRIFSPSLKEVRYTTNTVRLEIDCTAAGSWCEIDAVELIGLREGAVASVDDTIFFEEMRGLVNNPAFSDVKLFINDVPIFAHKAILAARSPFFHQMLESKLSDTLRLELDVPLTESEMLAVMSYIYTNRIPQDCTIDELMTLYKCSAVFELKELKTTALHRLLAVLQCENVVNAFKRADQDDTLDDVRSICLHFMADHIKDMANVSDFETLSQNILVKVLQLAMSKTELNSN